MIKEVTKYQSNSDQAWRTFDNSDDAKKDARDDILRKFLINGQPETHQHGADWQQGWRASTRQRIADGKNDAFENGYHIARYRVIRDFLKFYPEIMDSLKKIDDQKIEKVK